jgi:hypothetical protein
MKARTPRIRAVHLQRIVASLSQPVADAALGPLDGAAQPDQGPTPPMASGAMRST